MEKRTEILTPRQISTLKRRQHLVESAAYCFFKQGFHRTSIRDIAKQAGVSLGNLYNHFDSKTELIAEIASLEAKDLIEIEAVLKQPGPTEDRLIAFVNSYFAYAAQPESAVLNAEITAEAMRSPEIAEGFVQNRKHLADLLGTLLMEADNHAPDQIGSMAETIVDMIEGAASRSAFKSKRTKNEMCHQLAKFVLRFVYLRKEKLSEKLPKPQT